MTLCIYIHPNCHQRPCCYQFHTLFTKTSPGVILTPLIPLIFTHPLTPTNTHILNLSTNQVKPKPEPSPNWPRALALIPSTFALSPISPHKKRKKKMLFMPTQEFLVCENLVWIQALALVIDSYDNRVQYFQGCICVLRQQFLYVPRSYIFTHLPTKTDQGCQTLIPWSCDESQRTRWSSLYRKSKVKSALLVEYDGWYLTLIVSR